MNNRRTLVLAAMGVTALSLSAFAQSGPDAAAEERTSVPLEQRSTTAQHRRFAPEVYERLASSADGSVYAAIALKFEYPQISSAEQRIAIHTLRQGELIALFEEGEFESVYVAEGAVIYGHLTAEGLSRLANRPDVRDVRLSKVDPAVHEGINTRGTSRAFVSLNPAPDNLDRVDSERYIRHIQGQVLRKLAGEQCIPYVMFDDDVGFAIELNARCLKRLARDREVTRIELDPKMERHLASAVPYIHADAVHAQGYTGGYTGVAVLDDGFDETHPDLAGDIWGLYRIWDGVWKDTIIQGAPPLPFSDHGTWVASIITAPTGVAPDAIIYGIRIVDQNGWGYQSYVTKAVKWVIKLKNYSRPWLRTINMSGGEMIPFSDVEGDCFCDEGITGTRSALRRSINEAKVNPAPEVRARRTRTQKNHRHLLTTEDLLH